MSDQMDARLRELTYRLIAMAPEAPPFPEEAMVQLKPVPVRTRSVRRRTPYVWAAAATLAALVLVGVPLLLLRPPADDAVETPPTTQVVVTTTAVPPDDATPVEPAPATTAVPTAPAVDLTGEAWLEGRAFAGVFGADGEELAAVDLQVGVKSAAWDGGDGLVYLTSANQLRWLTPSGDVLVADVGAPDGFPTLLDVVVIDGRPLAALADGGQDVTWIDVATGEPAAGPADRFVVGDRLEITVAGRTVFIQSPDWSDIARGEGGEPIPPFPLPQLVVLDAATGAEQLRAEIGTEARPFAALHDFDGRRLIYSVEPAEPALAPRTVTILDLECSQCTQTVESDAGGAWFDLVGGGSGSGAADCSAADLDVALVAQPALPAAVAVTRQAIYDAATACDIEALAALADAGDVPFTASFGGQDAGTYWTEAERRGEPILADLVRHLNQPVGVDDRGDPTFYVWPSAHRAISLDEIPAEDYAALLELYSAEELQNMYDVIGGYVGWRITIDETGDWLSFVQGD